MPRITGRALTLLCLAPVVLATACAPLRETRSATDIACTNEAERVVLQQNRSQNMRLDVIESRTDTRRDESAFTGLQITASEYAQRERLRRECLGRTAAGVPAAPAAAVTAPASTPAPVPSGASAPVGEFRRGTALPPPPAMPDPAPTSPPVRGW